MSTKSKFAGLSLRNPIIAASCSRTGSIEGNISLDKAGVGAIVLKSLFEENIIHQSGSITNEAQHTEGADYAHGYLRSRELNDYIELIKGSKAACEVPIIASISCVTNSEWQEFARLIEEAGADALELNVMDIITSTNYTDGEFEQRHIDITSAVVKSINIPVIVKLGAGLTNPISVVNRLKGCGAKGVVLFNRMYQSDIDIDKMAYTSAEALSSDGNLAEPLRWVGIASAKVKDLDIALSGGVQSGEDVVKSILAGAAAVEVCSALYRHGTPWITTALERVERWQAEHSFSTTSDYRGRLNGTQEHEREMLVRRQFLRHFGSKK